MLWDELIWLGSFFLQYGASLTLRQVDFCWVSLLVVQTCLNHGLTHGRSCSTPCSPFLREKGRPEHSAWWPDYLRICRVFWEEVMSSLHPRNHLFDLSFNMNLHLAVTQCAFLSLGFSLSLPCSLSSPTLSPPCPLTILHHMHKPRGLANCQGGHTSGLADHYGRTSQLNLQRGRGVR